MDLYRTKLRRANLSAEQITEVRIILSPGMFANLTKACLIDMGHLLAAPSRTLALDASGNVIAHRHALADMTAGGGMRGMDVVLRTAIAAARAGDLTLPSPE